MKVQARVPGLRWIAAGLTALAAASLLLGFDPRLVPVNWRPTSALRFQAESSIEVARAGLVFRRSSLSLICGGARLHLVLRSRLPLPRGELRPDAEDEATIFISGIQSPLRIRARLVDAGVVDTIVTAPLRPASAAQLAGELDRSRARRASFMIFETGTHMKAVAAGAQVRAFVSRCR